MGLNYDAFCNDFNYPIMLAFDNLSKINWTLKYHFY